jgi:predicted nucleotidyltransferase/predicted transcriptional regulator with HTH domain
VSILTGSKLRKKIYTYTFTHIDEKYYVRELAALIGEDAGNLSRELKRLAEEGVFCFSIKGREKYYFLNKKYPLFEEIKNVIFKTEGVEGSIKNLVMSLGDVIMAFLYGSFAKGKEKNLSDIDLALVVSDSFDEKNFVKKISSIEKKLSREINYVIFGEKEFIGKKQEKGGFLSEVLAGKIIILKGDPWK